MDNHAISTFVAELEEKATVYQKTYTDIIQAIEGHGFNQQEKTFSDWLKSMGNKPIPKDLVLLRQKRSYLGKTSFLKNVDRLNSAIKSIKALVQKNDPDSTTAANEIITKLQEGKMKKGQQTPGRIAYLNNVMNGLNNLSVAS